MYGMRKEREKRYGGVVLNFVLGRTIGSLKVVNFVTSASVGLLTINLVSTFTKVVRSTRKMLANGLRKSTKTVQSRRSKTRKSKAILRKWRTYVVFIFLDVRAVNEIKNMQGIIQKAFEIVNCSSLFVTFRQLWPHI